MNQPNLSESQTDGEANLEDAALIVSYKLHQDALLKSFENFERVAKGGFPVEATRCTAEWNALMKCIQKESGAGGCDSLIHDYRGCADALQRKYVTELLALKAKGI